MERLKRIVSDGIFVLQILIVFVLVFENRIEVPAVLQAFGRMHPLLLHLPIGLLIVTVVLLFTRKYFEGKAVESLSEVLFHFTALTASLTTLMGLLLSLEGSFGASQLLLHKWLGVTLSFVCWGFLMIRKDLPAMKPLAALAVVLLVFTGHYGANLTHGEDYVWAPLQKDEQPVTTVRITDSTTLFSATVQPIFAAKCAGCHNPKKAKGNLILTRMEDIMRGGESGPLWKGSQTENSLLVERLLLPLDHDDHMPPRDKAQLTPDEIGFISLWIEGGANTSMKLKDVAPDDTLAKLSSVIVSRYQDAGADQRKYTFAFAAPDKIKQLSVPNRSVFQIARNEPAVQADFFLRETFDSRHLEELLSVKEQLISLNLSKMPVKDRDLDVIGKFDNLEVLNLNNTEVTGQRLSQLSRLTKLKSLSLSGTEVDIDAIKSIAGIESLKEVFIWNTKVASREIEDLKKAYPRIAWNVGFVPDDKELLKLNPPLARNKGFILNRDEKIDLRHNLPGTELRYTLDGSDPDSINSPTFTDPIAAGNYTVIKAQAFKEGWLTSDVAQFFFFRKGYEPDSAHLETAPDKRFQGEGVTTLLDGKQGLPDFYRHPAWMAFKENDLVLRFSFEKEVPTVKNITLSFAHNGWSICMPPDQMELWGGDDPERLELIAKVDPPEGPRPPKARIEGFSMDVPSSAYKYYRLVAKPVRKLADGNPNKRNLWLMVDEVFIN